MSTLVTFFQTSEQIAALSAALLHSIWQSVVVGLIYFLLLKIIPSHKPEIRHNLGVFSLFIILMLGFGTWSVVTPKPESAATSRNQVPARIQPSALLSQTTPEKLPMIGTHSAEFSEPVIVEAPTTPSQHSAPHRISSLLIPIWIAGVLLMLVRLICSLSGVQIHRTKAVEIDDPVVLERLTELCRRLEIRKKIQLAASSTLKNPGVIGVIKPMVLIPVSMLTTYSTSDIEAIVAHELAHIRRHDYFINLLQMLIEALLFFSPAVWWISHRISMEREVCCDAAAMLATGQQFEYANLLLNRFAASPATVPAFGNGRKTDARERLLRIVKPNQLFNVKISLIRLTALLMLSGLALTVLSKTSDLAVDTVTKILTPKERVEKLIELTDTNQTISFKDQQEQMMLLLNSKPDFSDKPKISISGRVITADGSTLPKGLHITYESTPNTDDWYARQSATGEDAIFITVNEDGAFSKTNLPALGTQHLRIVTKGYAPLNYEFDTPENMSDLELELDQGFPGTVHIQDDAGQPIPGATVTLSRCEGIFGGTILTDQPGKKTDQDGCVGYDHQNTGEIMLTIEADGFSKLDYYRYSFNKDGKLVVTLEKGIEIPGTVTDKMTGLPISDAQITLTYSEKNNIPINTRNKEIARTAADGSFLLPNILPEAIYRFEVKAPGKNTVRLSDITTETKKLNIEQEPERIIRGKLIGDLSRIGNNLCLNPKTKTYAETPSIFYLRNEPPYIDIIDPIPVTFTNGIGYFEIRNFQCDWMELHFKEDGEKFAKLTLVDQTVSDFTIDLDSDQIQYGQIGREVLIEVVTPPGLPKALGTLHFNYQRSETKEFSRCSIAISNGAGRTTLQTPGHFAPASAGDLKGYWVKPQPDLNKSSALIASGADPYLYSILAEPAGGVYGELLDAKGQPIDSYHLSFGASDSHLQKFYGITAFKKYQNKFALTSLPLNTPFVLVAKKNIQTAISDSILLTEENPIQNVTLLFKPAKPIKGQVLYPDGTPASNYSISIKTNIRSDEGFTMFHGVGDGILPINGRFIFHKVSDDPRLEYSLHIEAPGNYQSIEIPVKPGSDGSYTLEPKK
jgi:beta-lactamase regulating signal transducer with metallopeptidase domain